MSRPPLLVIITASALVMGRGQDRAEPKGQPLPREAAVAGTYTNPEYWYSVAIPTGVTAYRMNAPAPQHGIAIRLGQAEIWVNGEYDATEVGSLDALGARTADAWSKSNQLQVLRKSSTTLAGIPAREIVLKGEPSAGGVGYVRVVVGLRPVPRGTGIIYTLGLKAGTADERAESVLSALVKSFRLVTLPN